MNIPNDTGYPYRLLKYVQYHMSVPPIEPATIIPFCQNHKVTENGCILIAWYNSLCYCAPTALFLFSTLVDTSPEFVEKFWEIHKENLIFASARKYVKYKGRFANLMNTFHEDTKPYDSLYDWLKHLCIGANSSEENYNKVYKHMLKYNEMGRFSVELFTDMLVHMWDAGLISIPMSSNNTEFNWENGLNVTSGLLNMFYRDDEADEYDKTGKVTQEQKEFLNEKIKELQAAIRYYFPQENVGVSVITPKICSWRNLFKNKRYGGYHHDRQLEQIRHYEACYPDCGLWKDLYGIRKQIHHESLLGEIGGWNGVRKERKKLWTTQGKTGVESIYE